MSFVNQILAEAGGRKNLTTTLPSILPDIEFPPFYDSDGTNEEMHRVGPDFRRVKIRYFRNFIFASLLLSIVLLFLDKLPINITTHLGLGDALTDNPVMVSSANAEVESMLIPTIAEQSMDGYLIEESTLEELNQADEPLVEGQNSFPDIDDTPFRRMIVLSENPTDQTNSINRHLSEEVLLPHNGPDSQAALHADLLNQATLLLDKSKAESEAHKPAKFERKPTEYKKSDGRFHRTNFVTKAQSLLKQGDAFAALSMLSEGVKTDPKNTEAILLLSSIWLREGNQQQAAFVLHQGLKQSPKNTELAQPLAHYYLADGQVDVALAILLRAAPGAIVNPEYHSFIAALQQQKGQHIASILSYKRVLAVRPKKGKWWLGLGISMLAEMRYDEARMAFKNALKDTTISPPLKQFAHQRLTDLNGVAANKKKKG